LGLLGLRVLGSSVLPQRLDRRPDFTFGVEGLGFGVLGFGMGVSG